MILITGATGKTGGRVAQALLAEKQPIRILTRSPEKVRHLAEGGAEVLHGVLGDTDVFRKAADGCTGIYLITSLDWTNSDPVAEEIRIGKVYAEALNGSTAQVVYLSVLKSRDKTGIPHFDSKAEIEAALEAACANLLVLRPAFFMENFYATIPAIASKRTISFPLPPEQPVAMVSCQDIAEIVKQAFVRGPKGKEACDVIGLRCYTMSECARYVSNAIGRTVYYRQMPPEDWAGIMKSSGASERATADILTMFRWFSENRLTGDFDNIRKAFKYTSVTFEKFANELVESVRAAGGRRL